MTGIKQYTQGDAAIQALVKDLRPVKAFTIGPLRLAAVVSASLGAFAVYALLGFRPEMMALAEGHLSRNLMVYLKPLLFLSIAASILSVVIALARPEGRLRKRDLWPVWALLLILVGKMLSDLVQSGPASVAENLNGTAGKCLWFILIGGTAINAAIWVVWLKRSATTYPSLLGALTGLLAGSLMAGAYALHCVMDSAAYVLLIYAPSRGVVFIVGSPRARRIPRTCPQWKSTTSSPCDRRNSTPF